MNFCYFCGDSSAEDLIHMEVNSLIMSDSVYIDFAQLILDLFQCAKVYGDGSSNMICVSCKDHLSQFYVMKQQAKKYLKPEAIRKLQIVEAVTNFLESTEAECIVTKHSQLLAIHPDSNTTLFDEQLFSCNVLLDAEVEDSQTSGEVKQDSPQMETYEEYVIEEVTQDELADASMCEELIKEEASKLETETQTILQKVPRKKSNLDDEQRKWVRNQLNDSEIVVETTLGRKAQWICKNCPFKSFLSENAFRTHLRSHLDNAKKPQKGSTGKKQINSEEQSFMEQKLWIHQQLQSQKEVVDSPEGLKTEWSCSQCQFVTNKRGRFRVHLQKTHTSIVMRGPNKHSCVECHLRFDGKSHLIVHQTCHRIFSVIAPYAIYPECSDCKIFFATQEDLQIHIERHAGNAKLLREPLPAIGVVHRNGEPYVNDDEDLNESFAENSPACGHCLLKFRSESDCKEHLMLYHATFFTCPFDSRVFSGIPTLSFGNHLKQNHPDIFPDLQIACSLCKMQFETVYEKLAHMKKCKSKSFQCDHCDRSFFKKAELLHHLKVVTGLMVFACHFCGKRCKDQGDLKIHIRSHTNVRPYPCPHCDRAYKTSSARASHVESHMENIHSCNLCNVKFRRRILYQRHMKLLHDESYRQKCFAENTCKICNKSYLRKTHYKNHLKTHHV